MNSTTADPRRHHGDSLSWCLDVPLLFNPVILRQTAIAFIGAGVLLCGLLAIAFWSQGELADLLAVAVMIFAVCIVLAVTGLLAAALLYRNRIAMRFVVSAHGAGCEVTAPQSRRIGWMLALLGAAAGKPGVAGSGLLALSQKGEMASWTAIRSARFHERRRIVELRNSWRTVVVLYCTADIYDAVAGRVRDRLAGRPAVASPLLPALCWTAAVIVATLPSFRMPSPFEADLLPAMILLCFAVATVWLVPLLAWAILGASLWLLLVMLGNAFEMRDSILPSTPSYPAYTIAGGDDWAMLAIEIACLGFLAWFSVRALRGRFVSVLMRDQLEMGDGE